MHWEASAHAVSRNSIAGEISVATTSFSELLQKRAESYEAENRLNRELIDEWVQAVGKLFVDLRSWLAASDPTQILQIAERERGSNSRAR
jgi:hypothetical protein